MLTLRPFSQCPSKCLPALATALLLSAAGPVWAQVSMQRVQALAMGQPVARHRMPEQRLAFTDVVKAHGAGTGTAALRDGTPTAAPWRHSRAVVGFERGGLGLQLDAASRLSLNARHGGPVLTVRSTF